MLVGHHHEEAGRQPMVGADLGDGLNRLGLVELLAGEAGHALALLHEAQQRRAVEKAAHLDQVVDEIAVQARDCREQDVVAASPAPDRPGRQKSRRASIPARRLRRTRSSGDGTAAGLPAFPGRARSCRGTRSTGSRAPSPSCRAARCRERPRAPRRSSRPSTWSPAAAAATPRQTSDAAGAAGRARVRDRPAGGRRAHARSTDRPHRGRRAVPPASASSNGSRHASSTSSSRRNVVGFGEPM